MHEPIYIKQITVVVLLTVFALPINLVSSPSLGDCSVRRLQSSSKLCTEQSPKDSDDTRCCTNTICPPEDEHSRARNL